MYVQWTTGVYVGKAKYHHQQSANSSMTTVIIRDDVHVGCDVCVTVNDTSTMKTVHSVQALHFAGSQPVHYQH